MSSSRVLHDYYEILKIPQAANIDSIKTSYKRLARIRHPDKNSNSTATSEFQLVHTSPHIYGPASANNSISSRKHIQLSWTPKPVEFTTLSIRSPNLATQHLKQISPQIQPTLPLTRRYLNKYKTPGHFPLVMPVKENSFVRRHSEGAILYWDFD